MKLPTDPSPSAKEQESRTEQILQENEAFRDHLATVNKDGKRIWLYTKLATGLWTKRREWVAYLLISLWIIGPWLQWDGQPFMLFNVLDRHFIILGQHFYPQDLVYFGILLLTFFLFIAIFTLIYGRVWCGWACPQTLFMEQIFRKLEYWIEGTPAQRRKRNEGPWTAEKIRVKALKQSTYVFFSLFTALNVLAYIQSKDVVIDFVKSGLADKGLLTFFLAFTLAFYLVFAWAREQVCTAMCPYGRLQGVLVNNHSLVVHYNDFRGEPRRQKQKSQILPDAIPTAQLAFQSQPQTGDCIDCKLCIQVCPTGIDIRNGNQLECIQCTACIDACDEVMVKVGKPTGLISYNTHHNATQGRSHWVANRRTWIATGLMVLLLTIDAFILVNRKPYTATLLRVPGTLYQIKNDQEVSNLYNLQIVNKTAKATHFTLTPATGHIQILTGDLTIPANGYKDITLFLTIDRTQLHTGKNEIHLSLTPKEGKSKDIKTSFLAP